MAKEKKTRMDPLEILEALKKYHPTAHKTSDAKTRNLTVRVSTNPLILISSSAAISSMLRTNHARPAVAGTGAEWDKPARLAPI